MKGEPDERPRDARPFMLGPIEDQDLTCELESQEGLVGFLSAQKCAVMVGVDFHAELTRAGA
jgi:hypothetical protein